MGKPGIMFYFEIRPCLEHMTVEEKANLLESMLEYGETGTEPKLVGSLRFLWPLLRDRIDRDTARYDRIVIRNQYASYAKNAEKNNEPKLSYEQWKDKNYPDRNQWED